MKKKKLFKKLLVSSIESIMSLLDELRSSGYVHFDSALYAYLQTAYAVLFCALGHIDEID